MKFKPSTHPDFELEAIEDGYTYLTSYLGTPEEFQAFLNQTNARPYVFEVDRNLNMLSRRSGIVSWNDEHPGFVPVYSGAELLGKIVPLMIDNGISYQSCLSFISLFRFGIESELNIYKDLEVRQVSRDSVEYGSYYQGVKLI